MWERRGGEGRGERAMTGERGRGVGGGEGSLAYYRPVASLSSLPPPLQAVPYDVVHQAELIEEKVHRGEMLSLHPLSFSNSMRAPAAPMLDPQTNRNAEQYYDPCDPTIGVRNEVFSVAMQVGGVELWMGWCGIDCYRCLGLAPPLHLALKARHLRSHL